METVAIVGVGLIGGSFGLALREAGFAGEILGVSSPHTIKKAIGVGAISRGATLAEAAASADLIYLAQPISGILQTIRLLAPITRPECLITDAGSTKALIVAEANKYLPKSVFLGGHPMAGKEQRGVEYAEATLFRNKPYVLTPTAPGGQAAAIFRDWLFRLECRIIEMDPSEHDRTVALTSHLPQLLSTALAATLAHADSAYLTSVFGSGLLDMTRLALSAPEVWMSVIETNKPAVLDSLQRFTETLQLLRQSLNEGQLTDLFEAANSFSSTIRYL